MQSRIRTIPAAFALGAVLAFGTNAMAADPQSPLPNEGTWKFVMRKLPDGTTLVPPAIQGASTAHNGVFTRTVLWHTPDGKPAFASAVSNIKMSDTEYTETLLFMVFDDGSGKPPVYNLTGVTKTSPITRDGQRIAYKLPFDPPSIVIEGDNITATAEGAFVDYWERVR